VRPHSIKSNVPVWKCAWCQKRKGQVTDKDIESLVDFLHRHGWTMEPLVFHECGICYAHCQLPFLQETELDGRVLWCRACRSAVELSTTAKLFLDKVRELWPGVQVILRAGEQIRSRIEQHDAYLKRRGDYDIITSTLDENWTDDCLPIDEHQE